MGGAIATYFAAGFPERVRRLAVLEGLGPPDMPIAAAPARLRAWVDATRELRARGAARPMTEEEAFARLRAAHPAVDAEALRSVLPHLVRLDEDGLRWAFDPLHRTPSPSPFLAAYYRALAAAVAAAVLFVSGGPAGYHPPDEEERLAAFRSLTRVELPRGGHMMHWTEPEALGDALASFFAR